MRNHHQAYRLGQYLRRHRRAQGLSTQAVADRSGVNRAHLVRIENGSWAPKPDTLKALAGALDLNLADVWAAAGYKEASELPAPLLYLRAKYRDLPEADLTALSRDVAKVLEDHGLGGGLPEPGEHTATDDHADAASKSPTTKGGSPS